ncbi:hypothetical protein [Pyrobaculum islandicum]|uniref:hypothetical protein n=1 Tax=Pyrobaculum islandicum TaxID=2277 RepID=UPI00069E1B1D|nr:hypothetical protein [Pyrobaculum islandicum]
MKIAIVMLLLVSLTFAISNATDPFVKIYKTIDSILSSVDNFLQNLKDILKIHIASMAKTLSVILGLIGAFLYFSGINKYGGRGMIMGAIVMYLLAEFVNNL